MFRIDKNMSCGFAQLNVSDLKGMKEYYVDKIGLDIISEKDLQVNLGIKETGEILLVLTKVPSGGSEARKAGLFHTAFLVPTRKDLGNILFSLLNKEVPVEGASDHGYSEALYLQDPKGNGIEIYCDKPQEEWTVNEDGSIPGVTEEMDAEGVLKSRDAHPSDRLPEGTKIGHMHLSVSNLDDSHAFYADALGLSLKYHYGTQAHFLAAGGYHHHIGINMWAGSDLPKRSKEDYGLRLFSLDLSSETEFERLRNHLKESGYDFNSENNHIILTDPNGIQVKVRYIEK